MERAEIRPKTEPQLKNVEHRPRSSAWGRMLIAGTLLFGLVAGVGATDRDSKTAQPKEGTEIAQVSQEITSYKTATTADTQKAKEDNPNCSKASKKVTKNGVTRTFTAETCDDWDYILSYFDVVNTQFKHQLKMEEFGGSFSNRVAYLGSEKCLSWIIKGESDTIRFLLIPDVTSNDGRELSYYSVDSGVTASPKLKLSVIQSGKSCDWSAIFSMGGKSTTVIISENGEVRDQQK